MGAICSCYENFEVLELNVRSSSTCEADGGSSEFPADLSEDGILGCSSIGTVVKTRCRGSKTLRAVKRISKKNIRGDEWKDEVMTLQKLDHPHICKLHETLEDLLSVYLVMELCQGGNLTDVSANRDRFNEVTVACLVRQMVSAVAHLHQHEVVHSDIRPENWLFESPVHPQSSALDMTLKMIDFGLATKHGCRGRHSARRTDTAQFPTEAKGQRAVDLREFKRGLCCIAPEQLLGGADGKADIWAIGMLSYFLLSGQSPFDPSEGVTSLENHLSFRNARYVFMPMEIWRPISSEAKNFVALCLQKDPESRPTARQILNLPWMRLAQGALDEERTLRSMGDGPESDRSRPLPTAAAILGSIERMRRSRVLEKAAIIATSRSLHADQLQGLHGAFRQKDQRGAGVLSLQELLRCLAAWHVPCEELEEMAQDGEDRQIEYAEFIADVREFQQNVQDSAVCALFRGFDGTGPAGTRVKRKAMATLLNQASTQKSFADAFPQVSLPGIVQELNADANGMVSIEQMQQLLQQASKDGNASF